jgi:cell division protein FtsB
MDMNLRRMSQLERDLLETQRQGRQIEERRVYLQSELAQLSPNALMYTATGERMFGPLDRLRAMESDYVAKSARYAESHPDLARMRQEMAALRAEVGDADTGGLEVQLKGLRTELATLADRYSQQHPDVIGVQRQIKSVELQLANARSQRRGPLPTSKPDNPAYIQLQVQLDAAEIELRGLKLTEAEIRARMTDVEGRIGAGPYVERELKALTRDLDNALSKYKEIKSKEMRAQLAEVLEEDQKGERLTLIEPPLLPQKPDKPNRPALLVMSLVFSFAGGVGSVALREALDDSVHDARSMIQLTDMAPLSVVPYIETDREKRNRILRRILYLILLIAGIAAALNYVHENKVPLDILWFRILDRFGIEA